MLVGVAFQRNGRVVSVALMSLGVVSVGAVIQDVVAVAYKFTL